MRIRKEIKGKMRADIGGLQWANVFSISETFHGLSYFVAKPSQEQQCNCRTKPMCPNEPKSLPRAWIPFIFTQVSIISWTQCSPKLFFKRALNQPTKELNEVLTRYLLAPDLEVLKRSCQTPLYHFPHKFSQQFFEQCLQQSKECHLIDGGHLDHLKGLQFNCVLTVLTHLD